MRHLDHTSLKRKGSTAEQIHNTATILRINILQIQQNAFTMKQMFDDFTAFLDLANIDDALAMRILRLQQRVRPCGHRE